MLIADGYVHSLKTLLDKSRAAEIVQARRAYRERWRKAPTARVIGWIARWWPGATVARTSNIGG